MPLTEFFSLLGLATAMSFSPGPNNTLSSALAANRGLRHAMPFVCAVPLGWALLLLMCAWGVGSLVLQAPALHWAIKLCGTGYLLWLAYKLMNAAVGTADVTAARLDTGFLQGVALQFVNIKAWALALAITAGWVIGKPGFDGRLATVLATMMAFAFTSNLVYALMGAALRNWLAQGKRLVWFNRLMATVLAATGIWMLTL